MDFGICTCGSNSGGGHAINCPLRPTTTIYGYVTMSTPTKDWQDGYDAGYKAGLEAAKKTSLFPMPTLQPPWNKWP